MTAAESQFANWLQTYEAILSRIVRSFAAQPQDQDDLLQEILVQLWLSLPRFKRLSEESTWIYRVAFNTALTWKRDGERKKRNLQLLSSEQIQNIAQSGNPELSEQSIEKLYQAIRTLAIVDATLVLLALDGLSYKQIAEIMGIKENSVGVRLNRVKAKLLEILERQNDEI